MHTGDHRWPGFTGQPTTSLTLWSPARSVETVHQSGVATGWTPTRTRQPVYGLEFDQSSSDCENPSPAHRSIPAGFPSAHKDEKGQVGVITSARGKKGAAPLAGVNRSDLLMRGFDGFQRSEGQQTPGASKSAQLLILKSEKKARKKKHPNIEGKKSDLVLSFRAVCVF